MSDPEQQKTLAIVTWILAIRFCYWIILRYRYQQNYSPAINNLANLEKHGGNNRGYQSIQAAIQADPQFRHTRAQQQAPWHSGPDQAELFATSYRDQLPRPGINEILGIAFKTKKIPEGSRELQKELDINPTSNTSLLNLLLLLQQGEAFGSNWTTGESNGVNPSEQCSLLLAGIPKCRKSKRAICEYQKLISAKPRTSRFHSILDSACSTLEATLMP